MYGDKKLIKPFIGANVGWAHTAVDQPSSPYYVPEHDLSEDGVYLSAHGGALLRLTPRADDTMALSVDAEFLKITGPHYGSNYINPGARLLYEWDRGLVGLRAGYAFKGNQKAWNFRLDYGYKLSRAGDTTVQFGAGFFPREQLITSSHTEQDCDVRTFTCEPVTVSSVEVVDSPTYFLNIGIAHYFSLF